jgi:RimJ/RimL family protein N-acetyltransferase
LPGNQTAIGIVTLIKRDYLDHPDIGFAFLPAYSKNGYAFEATKEVLSDLLKQSGYQTILATTIKENDSSVKLLKKLGFGFSKEITHEKDLLQLFSITKEILYSPHQPLL